MTEIEDPVRRQRMVFEHEGDALRAVVVTRPGGDVPAHLHPAQTERFRVRSGTVEFRIGRTRVRATAGDELIAQAGVKHRFRNTGATDAVVEVEVEPALRLQEFLEEAAALAREGKYTRRGIPRGFRAATQLADLMERYADVTVMASPPRLIQRATLPLLARFAPRAS
jgi:mannose-6-phosphate isomerase-like protein (cupin superfamily)